ncbi:mitochondrial pyruvate carrier 4 isoform X2 [Gastrolobium bilobum]|uniref:mitochondrial pyruvate carrier 4 isoform X2 n=1 Tax=Gastrolobium bilobum TaxID=150636 RepID=UPI002AB08487|nr:mitochondrial pyruvate carrier 4 isoform X2 [Gastrolobium bilobum]
MAASKLQALWNHPAGPKTNFSKPPEKLSYPQQIAVTATGLIWSRYSTVITPKNWNLFSVNVAMAGTGIYQLSRKLRHDYSSEAAAAKE